jgi:transcriptional regulator GlxA family with amidase domain
LKRRRACAEARFPLGTLSEEADRFGQRLNKLSKKNLRMLNLDFLAKELGMSKRTMSRRFNDELETILKNGFEKGG